MKKYRSLARNERIALRRLARIGRKLDASARMLDNLPAFRRATTDLALEISALRREAKGIPKRDQEFWQLARLARAALRCAQKFLRSAGSTQLETERPSA